MANRKTLIFLYLCHFAYCDWVADWMGPLQEQIRQKMASRRHQTFMDEDVIKMAEVRPDILPEISTSSLDLARTERPTTESKGGLRSKLEDTLRNAEDLLETLQTQIAILQNKESLLKDAIANGRSGVSTLTVTTVTNRPPRTYIVRDGSWFVCNGMVQYPMFNPSIPKAVLSDVYASPRCIGQEVLTKPDPCVFNSVIKYETVPERRSVEYNEDDFFCLKSAFNKTLEQYLSVPRKVVNNTCQNGIVRSFDENMLQCGHRVLSEYTYYPLKDSAATFPLEYCTEIDGSCKLIVAWHLTNKTIENFEFLKKDDNFKKFFIKPTYVNHIL